MISTASFAHMIMTLQSSKGQQNKHVFLNSVAAFYVVWFTFNFWTVAHQWYLVQRLCNSMRFLFWVWASWKIQELLPVQHRGERQWLLLAESITPGLRNSWSPGVLTSPLGCCWLMAGGYGRSIGTESCSSCALLKLFGSRILCGFCSSPLVICFWKNEYLVESFTKNIYESSPVRALVFSSFCTEHPVILNYFSLQLSVPIFFYVLKLHFKNNLEEQAKGFFKASMLLVFSWFCKEFLKGHYI